MYINQLKSAKREIEKLLSLCEDKKTCYICSMALEAIKLELNKTILEEMIKEFSLTDEENKKLWKKDLDDFVSDT